MSAKCRCGALLRARACFTDARCCSKLGAIIRLDAPQHGSADRCIPPPTPAHSPRIPQAAAAARVAGKGDVLKAARIGDTSLVGDHFLADAECVNRKDSWLYDPAPPPPPHTHTRLKMSGAGSCSILDVLTLVFSQWMVCALFVR